MKLGIVISSNDPETVWTLSAWAVSRSGRTTRSMYSCSALDTEHFAVTKAL